MSTPNIFTFATSELSQDAFLCWFLSWANKEYIAKDEELHKCATAFIREIFNKHKIPLPNNIESVVITKQDKNIDVLCVINDIYAIIIEDKTNTKNHSDQLERYYKEVESRSFTATNILTIYYKTEDQGNYSKVTEAGYKPFIRNDMVEVLKQYNGENNILLDYRKHLTDISEKVNSYKTLPLIDWTWHSWTGFYLELQKHLDFGEWDYVSNPNGGFLGYWWHWQGNENCQQYLQLEQSKLCFKICVKDASERKKLRSHWHRKIVSVSQSNGSLELDKPARFGNGNFMTVCKHKNDYRVSNENNVIDIEKTVALLKEAQKILRSAQISA